MKKINFLCAVLVLVGLVLSACASGLPSTDSPNVGGGRAVSQVIFTGVIERMDDQEWVIDGQRITVDPALVRGGPFVVGDMVTVEASIAADGSLVAVRVDTPSAEDLANDNSNANDNDNVNGDNSNANGNVNDNDNGNGNTNDNDSNDNDGNVNGGNDNDDNGNDDNDNDDNDSNGNGGSDNDDNGNDDNDNDNDGDNSGSNDNDDDDDDDDSNDND